MSPSANNFNLAFIFRYKTSPFFSLDDHVTKKNPNKVIFGDTQEQNNEELSQNLAYEIPKPVRYTFFL